MTPSTDHEREIALRVEEVANRGELTVESVADIAERLSFVATAREAEFFVKYVLWRLEKAKSAAS